MNWLEAIMYIGVAFAAAWAIRSYLRFLNDDKP
jgi:hypothetical protein